jgi:hypothetical protein
MSYKTVKVELDGGRVIPQGTEILPAKARALLTILQPNGDASSLPPAQSGAGLRHFLSSPDFTLTPEQFRASMEADFFEQ